MTVLTFQSYGRCCIAERDGHMEQLRMAVRASTSQQRDDERTVLRGFDDA